MFGELPELRSMLNAHWTEQETLVNEGTLERATPRSPATRLIGQCPHQIKRRRRALVWSIGELINGHRFQDLHEGRELCPMTLAEEFAIIHHRPPNLRFGPSPFPPG